MKVASEALGGDLPVGKWKAVTDQGHAHRHNLASRHAAQNTAEEEHVHIGGESGREQAQGQDGHGDLDHHDLA